MWKILLVGLGGGLGAMSRYLVGEFVTRKWSQVGFPIATMSVNIVGCLLIGVLATCADLRGPGLRDGMSPELRVFLIVGILGGFTTFSAFGSETLRLFHAGHSGLALLNVGVQVVVGLAAVWLGALVARAVAV